MILKTLEIMAVLGIVVLGATLLAVIIIKVADWVTDSMM